jgi:hypothetical protein
MSQCIHPGNKYVCEDEFCEIYLKMHVDLLKNKNSNKSRYLLVLIKIDESAALYDINC